MELDEAKRRRDVFMECYGNELTQRINDARPFPQSLTVSREVFEAIQEAFQHWPMRDEEGVEYVANTCFVDPKVPYDHVLFKAIPVTYEGALVRKATNPYWQAQPQTARSDEQSKHLTAAIRDAFEKCTRS